MSARRLTITVAAEEATCEACPRCTGDECDVFAAPRQLCADDDYSRLPACLAAERAHAEAIAQARREERARVVAWLRERAEVADAPYQRHVQSTAADALEREP